MIYIIKYAFPSSCTKHNRSIGMAFPSDSYLSKYVFESSSRLSVIYMRTSVRKKKKLEEKLGGAGGRGEDGVETAL